MSSKATLTIVIADDDADDRMLVEDAFAESRLANPRIYVEDGEQLLHYLRGEGKFAGQPRRLPGLILLDLKLPRRSGFEVLATVRATKAVRRIPVIVLTSSNQEDDIRLAYDSGANSYLVKPVGRDALVTLARSLEAFWMKLNFSPSQ